MTAKKQIVVVGAGIFGVTAAQELHQRGHSVTLLDPGPIPHPLASSTDITKMIRMDYGKDDFYFDLMETAFEGWDRWNATWGEDLYHEDGFLLMKKTPMEPGSFELESFQRLSQRGHNPTRMDSAALAANHPHWQADAYTDGYYNPRGGWAESGNVVQRLAASLKAAGVRVAEGKAFARFAENDARVTGVITADGDSFSADLVILATGAWTPSYLPSLAKVMWAVGLPVLHFLPDNLDTFTPPAFLPWAADISNTGWYGFPKDKTGVVKIANHGKGVAIDPIHDERVLPPGTEDQARKFLAGTFPALAAAPVVGTRLCLYCDTWDGDLWIDHDPARPGLMVAAGGSGHGFKFAPVLGGIIADVAEGVPNRFARRFAWRERVGDAITEDARFSG